MLRSWIPGRSCSSKYDHGHQSCCADRHAIDPKSIAEKKRKEEWLQGETTSTIASALATSFTSMATDIMDTIGTVLPIILPILGAIAVIGVGIKVFKKVTGR